MSPTEKPPTELGPGDWGTPPLMPDMDDVNRRPIVLTDWSTEFTIYLRRLLAHNPHSAACEDANCKWCKDVSLALKPQKGFADQLFEVALEYEGLKGLRRETGEFEFLKKLYWMAKAEVEKDPEWSGWIQGTGNKNDWRVIMAAWSRFGRTRVDRMRTVAVMVAKDRVARTGHQTRLWG